MTDTCDIQPRASRIVRAPAPRADGPEAPPAAAFAAAPCPAGPSAALTYRLPLELDDTTGERWSARGIAVLAAAVLATLAWASLTPIRELATARGQIQPAGQIRTVQHFEGGIVAEILVREGAEVAAQQPLVRLAPAQAESDLDALRMRIAALKLRKARAEALLAGKTWNAPEAIGPTATLILDQRSVFEATLDQKFQERQTLAAQVEQRRSELAATRREIETAEAMHRVQTEILKMREKLAEEGFASRKMLLDAQAAAIQADAVLNAARGRLDAGSDALAQAESRLRQSDTDARAVWSDEVARVSSDLAEAQETFARYNDRVERLLVRSPVAGTVLQIAPRSPGDVVRAGDPVVRVVPRGERLQAEVQIAPEDIAHVRVGDAAEMRLSAFDPGVYGKLRGRLVEISPYTLDNDQRRPFYRGRIEFESDDVAGGHLPMTPQPGMLVDAQIVTGAKSLMRYLLKPIYRGLDQAFTER